MAFLRLGITVSMSPAPISYNTLMRYLPPFEEKIRSQIRNEMAMTPLITVMGIKERLEKDCRLVPRGIAAKNGY